MENIQCSCGRITDEYAYGDGYKLKQNNVGQWYIGCKDCWNETHEMVMDRQFKYCPWCGNLLP